jgi:hypothetical protein
VKNHLENPWEGFFTKKPSGILLVWFSRRPFSHSLKNPYGFSIKPLGVGENHLKNPYFYHGGII